MTNRDWFCLALRLFGIWLALQSLAECVPYLILAISSSIPGMGQSYWIASIVWLVVKAGLGLTMLFFAPAIALRFYASSPDASADVADRTGESRSILKVGMQLIAVYALLLAIQPLSNIGIAIVNGGALDDDYLRSLLPSGLNLGFALLLITWNERVITFLEKLQYIAERDAYDPPPLSNAQSESRPIASHDEC